MSERKSLQGLDSVIGILREIAKNKTKEKNASVLRAQLDAVRYLILIDRILPPEQVCEAVVAQPQEIQPKTETPPIQPKEVVEDFLQQLRRADGVSTDSKA